MQGDLGVEQALGRRTTLTVSWAFNRGVRMLSIRDANVGPTCTAYTLFMSNGL